MSFCFSASRSQCKRSEPIGSVATALMYSAVTVGRLGSYGASQVSALFRRWQPAERPIWLARMARAADATFLAALSRLLGLVTWQVYSKSLETVTSELSRFHAPLR